MTVNVRRCTEKTTIMKSKILNVTLLLLAPLGLLHAAG